MTDEFYSLKEKLEAALTDLLDDLQHLHLHWTRDEFEEWLQLYLREWPHAKLVDMPEWRGYSSLDDTKSFVFHIQQDNTILSLAITQLLPSAPDYLTITREIAH